MQVDLREASWSDRWKNRWMDKWIDARMDGYPDNYGFKHEFIKPTNETIALGDFTCTVEWCNVI